VTRSPVTTRRDPRRRRRARVTRRGRRSSSKPPTARACVQEALLATGIRTTARRRGCRGAVRHRPFHCVYCDGYELRDQALAAYAHDDRFVRVLTQWSNARSALHGRRRARRRVHARGCERRESRSIRAQVVRFRARSGRA
jgi:hypothetical protein